MLWFSCSSSLQVVEKSGGTYDEPPGHAQEERSELKGISIWSCSRRSTAEESDYRGRAARGARHSLRIVKKNIRKVKEEKEKERKKEDKLNSAPSARNISMYLNAKKRVKQQLQPL